jgi:hypothetical protein
VDAHTERQRGLSDILLGLTLILLALNIVSAFESIIKLAAWANWVIENWQYLKRLVADAISAWLRDYLGIQLSYIGRGVIPLLLIFLAMVSVGVRVLIRARGSLNDAVVHLRRRWNFFVVALAYAISMSLVFVQQVRLPPDAPAEVLAYEERCSFLKNFTESYCIYDETGAVRWTNPMTDYAVSQATLWDYAVFVVMIVVVLLAVFLFSFEVVGAFIFAMALLALGVIGG